MTPRALLVGVALFLSACASGAGSRGGVSVPPASDTRWTAIASTPGAFRMNLVGAPDQAGPFPYQLKLAAGTEIPRHRHTKDLRGIVREGLQQVVREQANGTTTTQTLTVGDRLFIPANVLHRELFPRATVIELSGIGPIATERP